ncbi:MAG: S41 family peptidase [Clostridia bacterium]|nr:S41 family peptidase [Clostridia bacterium]
MKNSSLRTVALIWAAVMIAVVSSTATLLVSGRAAQQNSANARWVSEAEYETIQRYSRLEQVRETLMDDYYQELDEEALITGAIRGMTSSIGDPYTFYYTPEELTRSNENNAGLYRGIGVLLQNSEDGDITIVRVYPDTPAEEAGLRAGDQLLAVDGTPVSGADGRTYNEAINLIRGENGTQVLLTLRRGGETLDIPVSRGDVSISYASYQVLPGDIGYISISQFTGDAAGVFRQAIEYFKEQAVDGLVIDLRNNPGGLLDQVVSIADELLPTGVIVYIKERDGTRQDYYSDEAMYDVPLTVLVNDMSASASEILASAVQAFDRGTVVGINTYGKGIVQSLITYKEDGAGIQLTTSSYYDANDRCPQGVGVRPDIEIALEGEIVPLDPDPQSDNQLAAAIEDLQRQIADRRK